MFWDATTAALCAVYIVVIAKLINYAERECDRMARLPNAAPRWVLDAIWAALIVAWPLTVPVGWVLIVMCGATKDRR